MKDAKILVVDDDEQMQLALNATLTRAGAQVSVAAQGKQALEFLARENFELVITDQRMPEMDGQELLQTLQQQGNRVPVVMITAHGTIDQAVKAMQLGAADFITKPFSSDELLAVIRRVLSPENKAFREESSRDSSKKASTIVTKDARMIRVLEVAEAVAKSDATVLVQGESGTGKELVARLIHTASPRSKQPFIAVNCAALPENLLESELFGHEKGAFTGAAQRKPGKFELAHGGTILLDEISEMELGLQAKLLRVLQEREVDRVGGRDPINIDVRVVATTNRNLEEMVKVGKFRADLYYRLNVIPLTLPPLRERKGDIKLLVEYFMRRYLGDKAPAIPPEVMSELTNHPWPGNVRELQNAVNRAAILSSGAEPERGHFLLQSNSIESISQPLAASVERISAETSIQESSTLMIRAGTTVSEMERALILETLRANENNRTETAKALGISIRTLRNKLHEYGVAKGE